MATKQRALDTHLSQIQVLEDKILRLQQSLEKTKEAELIRQKTIKFQEQETEKMESDLKEAMKQPGSYKPKDLCDILVTYK